MKTGINKNNNDSIIVNRPQGNNTESDYIEFEDALQRLNENGTLARAGYDETDINFEENGKVSIRYIKYLEKQYPLEEIQPNEKYY